MSELQKRLRQHWMVAATSKELARKPIGVTVLETPVVLFRTASGVAALLDRCPHRNAPLAMGAVVGEAIQCPYHGWQFDVEGQCVRRPGCSSAAEIDCNNQSFQVCERDGLIWVNLSDTPVDTTPRQTSWHRDNRYASFHWTSDLSANFVDGIENLLDATHTPFVHAGLIRSESNPQTFCATVRIRDELVEAEYADEGKQSGWISKIFERDRGSSFGRFIPPCIAELEYTSARHTEFVLDSHFTPTEKGQLKVVSTFFVRKTKVPMFLKRTLLTPFFARVLKQDAKILQQQQDNVTRFGGEEYIYWEGDLLRGLIETWLRNGAFPNSFADQSIELRL